MKKMEKCIHKSHRNISTIAYLFLLIVMLTSISTISAFEFDNIKSDIITGKDISDYGKIEIRNSLFGIDFLQLDKVSSLELKENTEICNGNSCRSETEVIMYEDGKLIDEVRFTDLTKTNLESLKSYNIYIKNGEELLSYNYEEVKGNSDGIRYTLVLIGELNNFQSVDWQVRSQGTDWIYDWAIWTSSLENGTMAWWKLDETSGTDAVDSLGDRDMKCNSTNWTNGIINNGLAFNGSANIGCTNETFLDGNNTDLTISMWIKHSYTYDSSRVDNLGTFSKVNELAVNHWYSFFNQASGALFMSYVGEGVGADISTTTVSWEGGTWYHIVYRWSKTDQNMSIWVNGTNEINASFNNVMNDTVLLRDWEIGSVLSSTNYFNGTIDEVGVWNRSLTSTEISNLHNASAGLTPDELVIVTLNSPVNNTEQHIKSLAANCTSESSENGIKNVSLYHNGTGTWSKNQSSTPPGTPSTYEVTLRANFTDYKTVLWSCYACNNVTPTECNFGENRTFYMKKFIINEENYSQTTVEGTSEMFNINVSTADLSISTATLTYNNTDYLGTLNQDGFNYSITRTITIDAIGSDKNLTFNWTIVLEDSSTYTSTSHNQSVFVLGIDDCSVYTSKLFNMTLYDEDEQYFLGGVTNDTQIKLEFSIYSPDKSKNIKNYSHDYDQVNSARVCLQNPLTSSGLRLDGVVEYSSTGRFTEFYNFQNYTLDSTISDINISLYNLNSSEGQEFKITYKDSNFVPVESATINIQRKYVDEGVFKTTEIPKTNTEGYTIAHLVINDVIYNIIVMKEGVVLASFNDVVADCQNPALSTCSINLNTFGSSVLPSQFNYADDTTFTLTFNRSTREVASTFVIVSGATETVNLDVALYDTLGNNTVCNDTLISSGGSLSCIVPLSFGNSTIIAKLHKAGEVVGWSIMSISQTPADIFGSNLMFIGLIAFITIISIGISDNPMIMGIMLILGIIMLVALNIIYSPSIIGVGSTILWFVMAIILILIKGSNRQ